MADQYSGLLGLVPLPGESTVDWDKVLRSELNPYFSQMSKTPQNLTWHGEGDVWAHTKMICERLIGLEEWQSLERHKQEVLFLAALLHDIGKPACTRLENGIPVSPNHTSVGAGMVRSIFWKDFGLCGAAGAQQRREAVCSLIRYHSIPFHFFNDKSPEYSAIKIAATGGLVSLFSGELLSILVKADILGRISSNTKERLEHVDYFKGIAEEAGCLRNPRAFPSAFSRYAYLSGQNITPGQEMYNDTWGTVVMVAGLPGTGKDTYIRAHYPDLPMVSLDTLRKEMKISPQEPQGKIINAAREQAREYLRKKQPFVWNATNLTPALRQKQIDMFIGYKAYVKIIFLETQWDEMLRRNQSRQDVVPEAVIEKMLAKLIPPDFREAHEVEWILV